MGKYILAMTGASGAVYGFRLLEELLAGGHTIHFLISPSGAEVARYELGERLSALLAQYADDPCLRCYDSGDLFAPIASGSFHTDGMIVVPCTMATLGQIAQGVGKNLIARAADVCLKERRPLILTARETPLNAIHLENMLRAQRAGAVILPAMPSFYGRPQSMEDLIDTVVGRILDTLNIEHTLYTPWQ